MMTEQVYTFVPDHIYEDENYESLEREMTDAEYQHLELTGELSNESC